jgi:hypothetical protein
MEPDCGRCSQAHGATKILARMRAATHCWLCLKIDGGEYDWEPVVSESGGRLGEVAIRVINRLATIVSESDGVERVFMHSSP